MNCKYAVFLIPLLIIYSCNNKLFIAGGKQILPLDSTNFSSDVQSSSGMVVSASKYASQTGIEILKSGGNAVDAAVAVGFVLAVTYPQAGNIGGGGFMVIRTKDNHVTTIDFREKAPASAYRDMFLDENGNYDPDKALVGHRSAGVPGSVAGLLYALEKYGSMSRDDVLEDAINYAENGFEIEPKFAESLNSNFQFFNKFNSTKKIFTRKGSFKPGRLFVQKELANTLKLIKLNGKEGFYSGITAALIENEMKNNGGFITQEDLNNYQPVERSPVSSAYKGYQIYSMGPPSSGGICLIELLNIIENDEFPLLWRGVESEVVGLHLLVESMKRVYADRSEYMGDPEFYDVPVRDLTSKNYAKERRKEISDTVTPASSIKPGLDSYYKEGSQTTHYSVIDKDGNMVSVTTTLNNIYGSFVVVEGAGFLLNDEMDDFVSKPGVPNLFGLIGSEANSIQPNKRMLSSMSPTIVLKDNEPFMVLGSPGGGKIISTVFLTLLNIIDYKMSLNEAIDKPRFHHQWYPDYIQYEDGAFSDEQMSLLKSRGHEFKTVPDYGSVNAILIDWRNRIYYGHTDRRGYGRTEGY